MDKLQELKARAYDLIAVIQVAQRELNQANGEIAKLLADSKITENDED